MRSKRLRIEAEQLRIDISTHPGWNAELKASVTLAIGQLETAAAINEYVELMKHPIYIRKIGTIEEIPFKP